MTDFNTALTSFIAGCNRIHDEAMQRHYAGSKIESQTRTDIEVDGGKKFLRVVRTQVVIKSNATLSGSAHCFVATEDGFNRTLGAWKRGDVFKPASFKVPARGTRGNIFDEANGLARMGEYGPAYNR